MSLQQIPQGLRCSDDDHHCFGRYMEPGAPWTESEGDCSQRCYRRFECFIETNREAIERAHCIRRE